VRILLAGLLAGALTVWLPAQAPAAQTIKAELAQANATLEAGEADRALALLRNFPGQGAAVSQSQSAEARNLECRVLYTLEEWSAAVDQCQQAVNVAGPRAG
jgi:hypothetical protein